MLQTIFASRKEGKGDISDDEWSDEKERALQENRKSRSQYSAARNAIYKLAEKHDISVCPETSLYFGVMDEQTKQARRKYLRAKCQTQFKQQKALQKHHLEQEQHQNTDKNQHQSTLTVRPPEPTQNEYHHLHRRQIYHQRHRLQRPHKSNGADSGLPVDNSFNSRKSDSSSLISRSRNSHTFDSSRPHEAKGNSSNPFSQYQAAFQAQLEQLQREAAAEQVRMERYSDSEYETPPTNHKSTGRTLVKNNVHEVPESSPREPSSPGQLRASTLQKKESAQTKPIFFQTELQPVTRKKPSSSPSRPSNMSNHSHGTISLNAPGAANSEDYMKPRSLEVVLYKHDTDRQQHEARHNEIIKHLSERQEKIEFAFHRVKQLKQMMKGAVEKHSQFSEQTINEPQSNQQNQTQQNPTKRIPHSKFQSLEILPPMLEKSLRQIEYSLNEPIF